jgi:small subunit ribosomal protein S20
VANHKSAIKRIRSSERKRLQNRIVRGRARTAVKRVRQALEGGDVAGAQQSILVAIRSLDKAVSKGVLHRNNAARRKSRLMKAFHRAMQSASA